jgi:RNA polymerase sigma-70 factor (ECF subfamily)
LIPGADKQSLFEKIVEENRSRLRIIARANADANSYPDLEQEILLALWNSLDRFEGRSSLRTWFYRVASNTVSNFLRRNHRRIRETAMAAAEEPVTGNNCQNRDPLAILGEFTRSLGELDRMVFLMYLDNFSYSEMSEAIKVDEANLRVRMSRVKKLYESRYVGR